MWPLQVAAFRKRLEKVVGDKHEEVMGRMGAIMATGPAMTSLMIACKCTHGCLPWLSTITEPTAKCNASFGPCMLGR